MLPSHRLRPVGIAGVAAVLAIATLLTVRSCRSAEAVAGPRSYSLSPVWEAKDVGLPIGYQAATVAGTPGEP